MLGTYIPPSSLPLYPLLAFALKLKFVRALRLQQDKLRRKLEADLENTRKLLQTEKTKAADAQKRAGGADKTRRTEQRDQIRVLQELQDLR